MARSRTGRWVAMAGLVALAACTHGTPAAAPTPAPPGTALPGPATATVTTAASPSSSASTVGATASPTGGVNPHRGNTNWFAALNQRPSAPVRQGVVGSRGAGPQLWRERLWGASWRHHLLGNRA